jgi:hypothetical protein
LPQESTERKKIRLIKRLRKFGANFDFFMLFTTFCHKDKIIGADQVAEQHVHRRPAHLAVGEHRPQHEQVAEPAVQSTGTSKSSTTPRTKNDEPSAVDSSSPAAAAAVPLLVVVVVVILVTGSLWKEMTMM